ncbi:hypothetical protein BJX76DRAFT_339443 [Aspergillus varians]
MARRRGRREREFICFSLPDWALIRSPVVLVLVLRCRSLSRVSIDQVPKLVMVSTLSLTGRWEGRRVGSQSSAVMAFFFNIHVYSSAEGGGGEGLDGVYLH